MGKISFILRHTNRDELAVMAPTLSQIWDYIHNIKVPSDYHIEEINNGDVEDICNAQFLIERYKTKDMVPELISDILHPVVKKESQEKSGAKLQKIEDSASNQETNKLSPIELSNMHEEMHAAARKAFPEKDFYADKARELAILDFYKGWQTCESKYFGELSEKDKRIEELEEFIRRWHSHICEERYGVIRRMPKGSFGWKAQQLLNIKPTEK